MMVRSIALAGVLGVLVAAGAAYAVNQPGWRNVLAPWFGAPNRTVETALAQEDWPICTTMGSMGSEADWAQLDPDFGAGKKALAAEDWNGAIAALERSEEHTSELQSQSNLVCRLLLEKKKKQHTKRMVLRDH